MQSNSAKNREIIPVLELNAKLFQDGNYYYALVSMKDIHGNVIGKKIPIVNYQEIFKR